MQNGCFSFTSVAVMKCSDQKQLMGGKSELKQELAAETMEDGSRNLPDSGLLWLTLRCLYYTIQDCLLKGHANPSRLDPLMSINNQDKTPQTCAQPVHSR